MTILFDTSVVVDYLRQRDVAVAFVQSRRATPILAVATVSELYAGARSRREETRIERIIVTSRILLVSVEIAKLAGQHMKHYRASHGLDIVDALIAATAEEHRLTLATLNVKHFPMLKGLKPAY